MCSLNKDMHSYHRKGLWQPENYFTNLWDSLFRKRKISDYFDHSPANSYEIYYVGANVIAVSGHEF